MMDNEDRLWELVSLKLTGEITADELQELECFLNDDPQAALLMQSLEALWKASWTLSPHQP